MSRTAQRTHFAEFLDNVPGPFPWYLQRDARRLVGANGAFEWKPLGSEPPFTGMIGLHRKDGALVGVAAMYSCIRALGGTRFLAWSPVDASGPGAADRSMRFVIVDAERLKPTANADVHSLCKRLEVGRVPFWFDGGEEASVTLPTSLADGTHPIELPPAFAPIDEILALVRSTAPAALADAKESRVHLRVWSIRPSGSGAATVDVIPQDWFNEGDFDFDYEWVTRIARDPETGRLTGDGIRLGAFALDASGRKVTRWLAV